MLTTKEINDLLLEQAPKYLIKAFDEEPHYFSKITKNSPTTLLIEIENSMSGDLYLLEQQTKKEK